MNIIFLGAPGAGKGTQSEIVSEKFAIPTISTGNIIRAALKNETAMGLKARSYIEAGDLVPDDVVIGIIQERLAEDDCKNGFILDGFPRTIPQAEALDAMGIRIDKVIDIEVPDEKIAASEGICDACGGDLVQRADDAPETVLERLSVYHEKTEPLKAYYEKKNRLFTVQGQERVEDTTALTLKLLEE